MATYVRGLLEGGLLGGLIYYNTVKRFGPDQPLTETDLVIYLNFILNSAAFI